MKNIINCSCARYSDISTITLSNYRYRKNPQKYRDIAFFSISHTPSPHTGLSNHASLMLIPSYRPLISITKPVIKTIKVWSKEATSRLHDCFDLTEWDVFTEGADLDEYTTSVLAYIDFCTETVLTTKTLRTFPNQKPWFDKSSVFA